MQGYGTAAESARAAWRAAGYELPKGSMTVEILDTALGALQTAIPAMQVRVLPASYSPDMALAYPRSLSWSWRSARDALRGMKAEGVMMRLPLFFQLESPLAEAAHAAGAFIFVNDKDNMPLGAAALEQAGIGCIATTGADAAAFAAYMNERNVRAPGWFLIRSLDEDWTVPAEVVRTGAPVAQEVHLFPGLPLLVQCTALSKAGKPDFHIAEELQYEEIEHGVHVTGAKDDPLPLCNFPIALRTCGTCPCGKVVFRR